MDAVDAEAGALADDLNLRWPHRLSAVCVWLAVGLCATAPFLPSAAAALLAAAVCLAVVVVLNFDFYRLLARRRGPMFAARAFWLHALYYAYASGTFAWCVVEHAVERWRRPDRAAESPRADAE
ncbi:MAG: hypothetical protein R2712_07660 [Vicinamibacterales bacterium]